MWTDWIDSVPVVTETPGVDQLPAPDDPDFDKAYLALFDKASVAELLNSLESTN